LNNFEKRKEMNGVSEESVDENFQTPEERNNEGENCVLSFTCN
jgi:hypothetical protein